MEEFDEDEVDEKVTRQCERKTSSVRGNGMIDDDVTTKVHLISFICSFQSILNNRYKLQP
jgi:hypothetical protein